MTKRGPRARATPGRSRRTTAGPSASEVPAERNLAAVAVPISVEAIAWAAVIGFALALRFASLDHVPFSAGESARAFNAWLVSEGNVPAGWQGDATAALTSYLFRIFGSGETVARIIPAAGGMALVVSLWFARRFVGRGAALLAGTFIAFSPLAVHTSRSGLGFALGAFLSMVMVLSLLTYLEKPRPLPIVALSAAFGLGLASDAVATSTAFALVVFLAIEAAWRRGGTVSEALATFRKTADHWRPAALTLAAVLLLGVVQFGTNVDRLSLPGVRQWADMFALPGDDLPWHYQLSLLVGYEWPLLLGGAAGYLVLVHRWVTASRAPSLTQRLLLAWATVALFVVAFSTQRQSGQIVLLLLPLSLLAATLIEEAVSNVDWGVLKRWWPTVALALALTTYALVQLSRWAREGGHISGSEQAFLVLALLGAAAILAGGFYYLGRNGLTLALPVAAALALPFLVHSSLSLGFGDGTEFAADARFTSRIEPFRAEVARAGEERGLPVAVDPQLRDALGWPLRDSPVGFGDPQAGSAVVTEAGREPPAGFAPLGGPWRVTQGWAPRSFDILPAWRWLAHREPYGNLSTMDVQILVPTQ